jgi:hypothetical protein
MSIPRHYLYKAIVGSKPDSAPIEHLPLFESSEKIEHPFEYIPPTPQKSCIRFAKLPLILKLFLLSSALALTLFYSQSIINYSTLAYSFLLPNDKVHQQVCSQVVDAKAPNFVAAPAKGKLIDAAERAKWVPSCSSQQANHQCNLAIDTDTKTYWQTADGAPKPVEGGHWIKIDLIKNYNVHSIAVIPRKDAEQGGAVSRHVVQISDDDKTWQTVAFGTWYFDDGGTYAFF